MPGRKILENILLAQELMRGLNWKRSMTRFCIQLDISKAFDSVNRNPLWSRKCDSKKGSSKAFDYVLNMLKKM